MEHAQVARNEREYHDGKSSPATGQERRRSGRLDFTKQRT